MRFEDALVLKKTRGRPTKIIRIPYGYMWIDLLIKGHTIKIKGYEVSLDTEKLKQIRRECHG